jgi:hypothetical protein
MVHVLQLGTDHGYITQLDVNYTQLAFISICIMIGDHSRDSR